MIYIYRSSRRFNFGPNFGPNDDHVRDHGGTQQPAQPTGEPSGASSPESCRRRGAAENGSAIRDSSQISICEKETSVRPTARGGSGGFSGPSSVNSRDDGGVRHGDGAVSSSVEVSSREGPTLYF